MQSVLEQVDVVSVVDAGVALASEPAGQREPVVGVDSSATEPEAVPAATSDAGGDGVSMDELLQRPESPGRALKIGIAGAVALGAIASGFIISRQGRRVIREAWQGRRRTRLEDRVLEAIWEDEALGRRKLDVEELAPGLIAISGQVHSRRERNAVLDVIEDIEGVQDVEDRLAIVRKAPTPLDRTRARVRVARRSLRREG